MEQSTPNQVRRHYSPRALLVGIGLRVRQMGILTPILSGVRIEQKVVKDTPAQKLVDALVTILAGGHGLVEANKRVRPDRMLQWAFGRARCAEQSVISQTLDAATPENVEQMHQAMQTIYRAHSQGHRHDYEAGLQVLDIDLTGQPCGKKAAFASKGYFAKQRNRRGRQLGRVLATHYDEVVVDRLYPGRTSLVSVLTDLVSQAAEVLELTAETRARTLLRIDAHGGSLADVNWALEQGYQLHVKEYSAQRATLLAQSVEHWVDDPKVPARQVGWVTAPSPEYGRAVRRIAVRSRKANGQWGIGVLISTLTPEEVMTLARLPCHRLRQPDDVLLAYVYLYDKRGGGVETQFKADRQGLGIIKRNKKRFPAQQILTQLNALAHNLVIWARNWLMPAAPALRKFGVLRMVRDVFHLPGVCIFADDEHLQQIILNQLDPWVEGLCTGLQPLLEPWHAVATLDQI